MILFKNIKKFWQNGEFESSNGEKWSPGSDRPPLVDKMDIVEALAALHVPDAPRVTAAGCGDEGAILQPEAGNLPQKSMKWSCSC